MKKIYGNKYLLSTIKSMVRSGRTAHSVVFYGDEGSGRKLMAKYYTQALMCEAPVNGEPCGVCNSCCNVEHGFHPDVMYVEKTGKAKIFTMETTRAVISDAFVKPNNSTNRKVIVFSDCRDMTNSVQNALLKLIEEPPEYAYILFTCNTKNDFLPTIISRCACFALSPCSEDEARASLADSGYGSGEIEEAVRCFHGNIGMCTGYLTDDELRKKVDLTKSLVNSIIRRDEYSLNVDFFSVGSGKDDVKSMLSMLDKLVRDAAVLSNDENAGDIGCFRDGALRLSRSITAWQAAKIHRSIEKTCAAVELNVNIPLALAALCADIIKVVS